MNKNELKTERERIEKIYKKGFPKKRLIDWYFKQLIVQEYKCYYCKTSIMDIRKLIKNGILKDRKIRYEKTRGPNLEIDKKDNSNGYSESNCVLACYYCNNDKSYIHSSEEYLKFFGPNRHQFFKHLIKKYLNK